MRIVQAFVARNIELLDIIGNCSIIRFVIALSIIFQ